MVVIGGIKRDDGTRIKGFLIICTKCSWQSAVRYDPERNALVCTREECKNIVFLDEADEIMLKGEQK